MVIASPRLNHFYVFCLFTGLVARDFELHHVLYDIFGFSLLKIAYHQVN